MQFRFILTNVQLLTDGQTDRLTDGNNKWVVQKQARNKGKASNGISGKYQLLIAFCDKRVRAITCTNKRMFHSKLEYIIIAEIS